MVLCVAVASTFAAVYLRRPGSEWPLDIGDDPCFGWAYETSAPITWGVCRPDLRNALAIGDVVTFFAADKLGDRRPARYSWVGYATVADKICQADVFRRREHARYRAAPNLLIRPDELGRFEHFEPALAESDWHGDWLWRLVKTRRKKQDFESVHASNVYDPRTSRAGGSLIRLAGNYVVFSDSPELTWVADAPPVIAHADSNGTPETWMKDKLATELRALMFENASRASLRTTNEQTAHPQLRLATPAHDARTRMADLARTHGLGARSAHVRGGC